MALGERGPSLPGGCVSFLMPEEVRGARRMKTKGSIPEASAVDLMHSKSHPCLHMSAQKCTASKRFAHKTIRHVLSCS
eukprot:552369-Pelagomonas_calceolata.AAC.4